MLQRCAFLFLTAMAAAGADFSGIWTGHAADRNGDLQDFSFRFQQHEQSLTGKMYGDNESVSIAEGKVVGDSITFLVTTELNGSITKTLFTGILKGKEVEVTRERVGAKPEKPAPKQIFMLKQL